MKKAQPKMIKVRAVATGYIDNKRRKVSEVFTASETDLFKKVKDKYGKDTKEFEKNEDGSLKLPTWLEYADQPHREDEKPYDFSREVPTAPTAVGDAQEQIIKENPKLFPNDHKPENKKPGVTAPVPNPAPKVAPAKKADHTDEVI